ncbi:unnamed protein product [Eruca vesicaria subsp. sativa]|uniref:Hexosyltransferase n=1 Tax=Eruca vesicaria subsp. sativa TaxID=29727 RepID=A0ABC8KZ20_ERUVS|nr:unnamed protein product [Eruca vesicaria subsp. sativa]
MASCPENVFFHFTAAEFDPASPRVLSQLTGRLSRQSLHCSGSHRHQPHLVSNQTGTREAVELRAETSCVDRVICLDSDISSWYDDITKLWNTTLTGSRVIGAPEYCHANFTKYFTSTFWSGRKPCYFNTGVMVMDLVKGITEKRSKLGCRYRRKEESMSWVRCLLFFLSKEAIDHRWNQHGLGGDNVCSSLDKERTSEFNLLHWSGKGKPWVGLDEKRPPCPLDHLWEPYDLYEHKIERAK